MMLIVGTVPIEEFPLTLGQVSIEGEQLFVDGHHIPCTQGTGAMTNAALATTDYLKLEPPHVLLAGDIGKGKGSRQTTAVGKTSSGNYRYYGSIG